MLQYLETRSCNDTSFVSNLSAEKCNSLQLKDNSADLF